MAELLFRNSMTRPSLPWLLALVVVLVAVCVSFAGVASPAPYAYDESDYMYAGFQGIWANYVDSGAMSMVDFVGKGMELARDSSLRASLSQYVRSLNDISFYRHYHGPLYAYWIGMWHGLGVRSEASFRASGLILHAFAALSIFGLFLKAFPKLPVAGAFVASVMFLMNRTALLTGISITQHIFYEVLSVLTLLALAIYIRTRTLGWWYVAVVLLASTFAAVEIAVVLLGTVLLTVVAAHWQERRVLRSLLGKGALCFIGTLIVIWPKSVLLLDLLKGYMYLAYIAIYRKTFSPMGPMEMWGFKVSNYPLEFVVPLIALVAALWIWRKSEARMVMLPFLLYAVLFLGVTMVVTVPYVYYHGSLLATLAVITGIVYGEISNRTGPLLRVALLTGILATLIVLDVGYYKEAAEAKVAPSFARSVLTYLDQRSAPGPLYVPYTLKPPLHFYRSELATVGYDADWTVERLAQEALAAAPARVLCSVSVCDQLSAKWPVGVEASKEPVGRTDDTREPVYAVSIRRP